MAACVADRVHGRPRVRRRRLLRVPHRHDLDPHRARPRRRAAGVPERVSPPRQPASAPDPGHGLEELRCGYHRWCWGLDGRLREVPSRKGFGVLRNDDYPLFPASVDTLGPIVFVNPDPDAMPLAEYLEAVPDDLAWLGLDDFRGEVIVTVPVRGELEGRRRRLQRDVSRAGSAPRDDRLDGRHRRAAAGLGAHEQVGAALRRAEPALPGRARRPDRVGLVHHHPGRAHGDHRAVPGA